ncbi:hypothetical protein [Burkholderia vietnamiensis]|uniref:hypothetical protein n=1 Tax=Burkholderia vietnamiensis TaxID=60552 RepID=UPI00158B8E59|nr:hypothetical protein [Burkholderia vietnamiensis]MCA8183800.1 hypothetical protein [Burkholderia vietnamiensis]
MLKNDNSASPCNCSAIERINVLATGVFALALVIMLVGVFTAETLLEIIGWTAIAVATTFLAAVLAFLAGLSEGGGRG